jgi:hypothetical protein
MGKHEEVPAADEWNLIRTAWEISSEVERAAFMKHMAETFGTMQCFLIQQAQKCRIFERMAS